MDLQDALRSCKWRVDLSVEKLKSDMQSLNQAEKKTSLLPKKKSNNFSFFNNKRFTEKNPLTTIIVYDE
jgi:hypothetical protein